MRNKLIQLLFTEFDIYHDTVVGRKPSKDPDQFDLRYYAIAREKIIEQLETVLAALKKIGSVNGSHP